MLVRIIIYGSLMLNSMAVLAFGSDISSTRPVNKMITYSDVLNWTTSLLAILAVLVLCLWIVRKTGQLSATSEKSLALLAGLSLGMREKVVLIKVGDKQLLIGVTPGKIEKLLLLEGADRLFQEPQDNRLFSQKFEQILKGKQDE